MASFEFFNYRCYTVSSLSLLKTTFLICCLLCGPGFFSPHVSLQSSPSFVVEATQDVSNPSLSAGPKINEGLQSRGLLGDENLGNSRPDDGALGEGDKEPMKSVRGRGSSSGTVNTPFALPTDAELETFSDTLKSMKRLDPDTLAEKIEEVVNGIAHSSNMNSSPVANVGGRTAPVEKRKREEGPSNHEMDGTAETTNDGDGRPLKKRRRSGANPETEGSERSKTEGNNRNGVPSHHSHERSQVTRESSLSSENEQSQEDLVDSDDKGGLYEDVESTAASSEEEEEKQQPRTAGSTTQTDDEGEAKRALGPSMSLPGAHHVPHEIEDDRDTAASTTITREKSFELITDDRSDLRTFPSAFLPPPESGTPSLPTTSEARRRASTWPCEKKSKFVFLFVNAASGGGGGKKWIERVDEDGSFMRDFEDICSRLMIYDLHTSDSLGFQVLRDITQTKKVLSGGLNGPENEADLVRVIAIGGDGTVMWVNKESIKHGVLLSWTAVGIVGFGTGNDFAQSYGWQKINYSPMNIADDAALKKAIEQWQNAGIERHDIWRVKIITSRGGYFSKIDSSTRQLTTVRQPGTDIPATFFDTHMNLYFGIGFDSLVGMEFDRMRSTSRLRNRIMYALAFFKFFRLPWRRATDQVETIFALEKAKKRAILTTNPTKYPNTFQIREGISLTFLNNRSMIGGIPLWEESAVAGVKPPLRKSAANASRFKIFASRLIRARQSMGDKKIELIMFQDRFRLMRSVVMNGNAAARLLQHRGPLLVRFYPEKKGGPVPFQVDGEFYLGHHVKEALVEYARSFKVLTNIPIGSRN
ncbi:diacylglycerol kinase [Cystoisospora suis]|uniref:diacylglycerol kinase (ATP) n=1 Tax=Cystoisospora suis TaxID=483139 RepID=A0A2C6KWM4_9APIC|nr:diacylglycerol kinase [Cystoisospora suis]